MSKILTEDLIDERLNDSGVEEPGTLDKHSIIDILQKHYDCKVITEDWPSYADHYFYTSTTCDSYEVFVSADHDKNPSLYDEVYYYENDWLSGLEDMLINGNDVYLDSTAFDSYEAEEELENAYDRYYNDKRQEVEDELIDEGYEKEEEE